MTNKADDTGEGVMVRGWYWQREFDGQLDAVYLRRIAEMSRSWVTHAYDRRTESGLNFNKFHIELGPASQVPYVDDQWIILTDQWVQENCCDQQSVRDRQRVHPDVAGQTAP